MRRSPVADPIMLAILAMGAISGSRVWALPPDAAWSDRDFPIITGAVESLPADRELVIDGFDSEASWDCSMSPDEGFVASRSVPLPGRGGFALGLRVDFLRRGAASLLLRPRAPIAIDGICSRLSVRVLGRGYRHELRLVVLDYFGRSHELSLGRIDFLGWNTLSAELPRYDPTWRIGIVQDDRHYDRPAGLRIAAIKLLFQPEEAWGRFYAYFDDLSATIVGAGTHGVTPKESAPRAEATPSLSAASAPSADDRARVARVFEAIREGIATRLVYPSAAKRRGIEGTVIVLLVIDDRGGLVEARLVSSSGSDILDRDGLDLVGSLFPVGNDTGRGIRLELPIAYRLTDAEAGP